MSKKREYSYSKEHLRNINNLVQYIKVNAPIVCKNKDLRQTFFNNNAGMTSDVLKKLRDAGVLMSVHKKYGSIWYYLDNSVDLNELFDVEEVVHATVHADNEHVTEHATVHAGKEHAIEHATMHANKEHAFSYKGLYTVKEVITTEDKIIAKQIRIDLGNDFCERLFIDKTSSLDWSKEKTWFLFDKIIKYMPYENLID
jgi:hypothetical protein